MGRKRRRLIALGPPTPPVTFTRYLYPWHLLELLPIFFRYGCWGFCTFFWFSFYISAGTRRGRGFERRGRALREPEVLRRAFTAQVCTRLTKSSFQNKQNENI